MKNKILLGFIVGVITMMTFGTINSFAVTEDIYTYSVNNNTATITKCSSTASGKIAIPSTLGNYPVTSIGSSAFKGCSELTGVTIPTGVTNIGSSAFKSCSALTDITIPNSITSIGGSAFDGCNSLSKVNISSIEKWCSIEFFDVASNPLTYAKKLYLNNSLITDLIIPEGVTSICYAAFYNCTELQSVTFPDSLTFVGQNAFSGCINIIRANSNDIGKWCGIDFYSVDANPLFYANKLYVNDSLVTNLVIPSGIEKIKQFAFPKCIYFQTVTIPEGVTSIEYGAFSNCTGLTNVIIPDSVIKIGNAAFSGCTTLENVKIGNCVENIGDFSFYNCSSLKSVIIPDSVTSIGSDTFSKCTNLQNVIIGDGVTSIGGSAFSDCSELTKVILGDSVETIKASAFKNCTGLAGITLPDSVTSIWQNAFLNCDLVICGKDGSKAYEYAALYSIPFVDIATLTIATLKTKTECVTTSSGKNIFATNPCSLAEDTQIVFACYNNGQLVDIQSEPNKNEVLFFSTTKPFDSSKVMVWNSYKRLSPLCEAENVK